MLDIAWNNITIEYTNPCDTTGLLDGIFPYSASDDTLNFIASHDLGVADAKVWDGVLGLDASHKIIDNASKDAGNASLCSKVRSYHPIADSRVLTFSVDDTDGITTAIDTT